jgi:hypothetical protein
VGKLQIASIFYVPWEGNMMEDKAFYRKVDLEYTDREVESPCILQLPFHSLLSLTTFLT